MANNLGQPTIQEILNVMCDKCNAVICLGCPVYELDKHARAQPTLAPDALCSCYMPDNYQFHGGTLKCAKCGKPARR